MDQGHGPHHRRRLDREHSAHPASIVWLRSSRELARSAYLWHSSKNGRIDELEMLRTFNMGIGMAGVVAPGAMAKIQAFQEATAEIFI